MGYGPKPIKESQAEWEFSKGGCSSFWESGHAPKLSTPQKGPQGLGNRLDKKSPTPCLFNKHLLNLLDGFLLLVSS